MNTASSLIKKHSYRYICHLLLHAIVIDKNIGKILLGIVKTITYTLLNSTN